MHKLLSKFLNRNIGKSTAIKYEQTIKIMDEDVVILKSVIKQIEEKQGHQQEPYDLFGTFIFLRICFKDILMLEKYIKTVKITAERNLFARMLALQLYELLDDIGEVLGKKFETYLSNHPFYEELKAPLNNLRSGYNAAKKKFTPMLKEIRHNTAAHKHHDAIRQMEVIESINISEIEIASAVVQIVFIEYLTFEKQLRNAMRSQVTNKKAGSK